MWKKTDADEKEFARQDLAQLTKQAERELIDLVYFDQSSFNLWAKVVYAWQKRGERIAIPASRGKSNNVLGFMWHKGQRFASFVFEGAIDSNVVIGCFDIIAQNIKKQTVIVLDNAPIHFKRRVCREDWRVEEVRLKSVLSTNLLSKSE